MFLDRIFRSIVLIPPGNLVLVIGISFKFEDKIFTLLVHSNSVLFKKLTDFIDSRLNRPLAFNNFIHWQAMVIQNLDGGWVLRIRINLIELTGTCILRNLYFSSFCPNPFIRYPIYAIIVALHMNDGGRVIEAKVDAGNMLNNFYRLFARCVPFSVEEPIKVIEHIAG